MIFLIHSPPFDIVISDWHLMQLIDPNEGHHLLANVQTPLVTLWRHLIPSLSGYHVV
jgi:hypothetical protein